MIVQWFTEVGEVLTIIRTISGGYTIIPFRLLGRIGRITRIHRRRHFEGTRMQTDTKLEGIIWELHKLQYLCSRIFQPYES